MPKKNRIDGWTLVLAVGIMAVALVIYGKLHGQGMGAEEITDIILDDHAISLANKGVVDESKLEKIKSMDYGEFKKSLNAKNDFCVYIEDEKGNIILAKGFDRMSIDGLYCKT